MKPENKSKLEAQELDEEKPGLGQHYCLECAKYYESDEALVNHTKSKVHRRRLKELKFGSYTKEEAERTAGRGVDNKQRGVEPIVLKKKEDQDLEMEGQDSKTASTTTTAQETAVSS